MLSIVWYARAEKLNFPNSFRLSLPPFSSLLPSFRPSIKGKVFLTLCIRRIYLNDPWIWKINLIYFSLSSKLGAGRGTCDGRAKRFGNFLLNGKFHLFYYSANTYQSSFERPVALVSMITRHSTFDVPQSNRAQINSNRKVNCFEIISFFSFVYLCKFSLHY